MKFDLDNSVNLIKYYFELLGGNYHDFSIETANRVRSFGMRARAQEKLWKIHNLC